MKELVLISLILFLSGKAVLAGKINLDKTYIRDSTHCRLDQDSAEIELRSFDKYTNLEDSVYGEYVVLKKDDKKKSISMNNDGIGRYRFLKGSTPECTKTLNLKISEKKIILFLAKENKPFGDTLTLLYLDLENGD